MISEGRCDFMTVMKRILSWLLAIVIVGIFGLLFLAGPRESRHSYPRQTPAGDEAPLAPR
jgi:hypothetical protein